MIIYRNPNQLVFESIGAVNALMKNIRILALVTDALEGFGGIAQYNRDLFQGLAQLPEVLQIIICPKARTQSISAGKINQLPGVSGTLAWASHARKAAKSGVDVIFCGHINLLPVAAYLANKYPATLWLQIHGIEAWNKYGEAVVLGDGSRLNSMISFSQRLRSYWVNRSLEHVDRVSVVSRYSRRRFIEWSGLNECKVKVVPNTVSADYCDTPADGSWRKAHNLVSNKLILTVGRLSKTEQYKGHDRIILLMEELLKEHLNLIYLIVGEGDDQERLENLAKQCGVAKQVRFLGKINSGGLLEIYKTVDLFVLASTGEGFGISYLEAMASGVPALGLNLDGSADPLLDGKLGFLADPGTLGKEILHALSCKINDELSNQVKKHFGQAVFQQQLENTFKYFIANEQSPCVE